MKLFRFLEIQGENQTPDITNQPYSINGVIFVINMLIIIAMIIIAIIRTKKNKRNIFLNTIVTILIITNIGFLIPNSVMVEPQGKYRYEINTIEETTKIKIIVEAREYIPELEITLKFFDNSNKLVFAESNKITELECNNYKTIEYNKPNSIILTGGRYQLIHDTNNKKPEINTKNAILEIFTFSGIIISIPVALITKDFYNKKEKSNTEDRG